MKTPVAIGMPLRGRPGFVRRGPARALPASNALAIADLPVNQVAWNPILITLCDLYNGSNFSFEKLVSHKTRDERRRFLFTFFKELRRDPERSFRIDPRQLGDRHVQWAFKRWVERGLAPATIQTYLSFLRVFELWIGKPGMVKSAEVYARQLSLPADQPFSATRWRSRIAAGNDESAPIAETIRKVDDLDPWVGAQLRIQAAFGARVKESICFRPWSDAAETFVTFDRGTKGGRKREVRIETDAQRAALAHARERVQREDAPLADPGRTSEAEPLALLQRSESDRHYAINARQDRPRPAAQLRRRQVPIAHRHSASDSRWRAGRSGNRLCCPAPYRSRSWSRPKVDFIRLPRRCPSRPRRFSCQGGGKR